MDSLILEPAFAMGFGLWGFVMIAYVQHKIARTKERAELDLVLEHWRARGRERHELHRLDLAHEIPRARGELERWNRPRR